MTAFVGTSEASSGAGAPSERVLFVCTHNATRSPMAAALASAHPSGAGAPVLEAASAGVFGDAAVDPMAVAAMAEIGIDIRDHRAHSVAELERSGAALCSYAAVIVLTDAAEEAVDHMLAGAPTAVERWDIADPTQTEGPPSARLAAYRRVRDAIAERIFRRFGVRR